MHLSCDTSKPKHPQTPQTHTVERYRCILKLMLKPLRYVILFLYAETVHFMECCLHLYCYAQRLETKTCTGEQGLWCQTKSLSLNMRENSGCFIFIKVAIDAGIVHQKMYVYIYVFFFFSQAKSVSCCSDISDKISCQGCSQTLGHWGVNIWVFWSSLCFSVVDNQKWKAIIDGSS